MSRSGFKDDGTFVFIPFPALLLFLKRGLLPALALALLAGAATWLLTRGKAQEYVTEALLLSVRPEASTLHPGALPLPALDPAIYNLVLHRGPVLEKLLATPQAARTLQEPGSAIRVLSDSSLQSTVVRIEVKAADPAAAAGLANAAARELINWDLERAQQQINGWTASLTQSLEAIRSQLDGTGDTAELSLLQERYDVKLDELLAASSLLPVGQLSLLREAVVPELPQSAHAKARVALAGVFGVLAAYLLQLGLIVRNKDQAVTGRTA